MFTRQYSTVSKREDIDRELGLNQHQQQNDDEGDYDQDIEWKGKKRWPH